MCGLVTVKGGTYRGKAGMMLSFHIRVQIPHLPTEMGPQLKMKSAWILMLGQHVNGTYNDENITTDAARDYSL